MLIHPNDSHHAPHVHQGVVNDLGMQPFTEYFQRTGPLVDVYETQDEVIISCEVPGLQQRDDANIHVSGSQLMISGIIQRASEDAQDNRYHRTERFFGHFNRMVELPARVNEETARAFYKNGILEVRLQKSNKEQGKRIDIQFQ